MNRPAIVRRLLAASIAGLALSSVVADAAPLGRLFFSPERRAALERQRQFNIQETQTIQGGTLRLDGIVKRSSGRTTVWINGQPQNDRSPSGGIAVHLPGKEPGSAVLNSGDGVPAKLRVGEAVNRGTRDVADPLSGGRIRRDDHHQP